MSRLFHLRCLLVLLLVLAALAVAAQTPPLFYAVVSDTQKGDNNPFADFRWAVEQINDLRPQFVLFPGDLTSTGTVNQYENWIAVRRNLQVPLYACPGNHEGYPGPAEYAPRFAAFLEHPTYYTRSVGGWTLFALDGVSFVQGQVESQGQVSPEQLQWLRSELERLPTERPLLVFCHFPFFATGPHGRMRGAPEILSCFDDHYLAYTVAGHWHVNAAQRDDRERLHLVTNSLSFTAAPEGIGYRLLSTVGQDLYTAWVRRDVAEPLSLLGETHGANPLTVYAPPQAGPVVVRVAYQGGPVRVRLLGPGSAEWVGILPFAPVATQALVPLRGAWPERLSGPGSLRLTTEALAPAQVERLSLYSTPLIWEHYRLPFAPSCVR